MYTILWLSGGAMMIVVKYNPQGEAKVQYLAEVTAHLEHGIILEAYWNNPRRDLGYTVFEPGDHFVEYFYTDRWFNIFAISTAQGERKGWYCNVAAPALISEESVEQIDLLLDVWVNPDGQALILDEDEFAADLTLTDAQRKEASQGLQTLIELIEARDEPFCEIDKGVITPN
jgi:uncharacterized protein